MRNKSAIKYLLIMSILFIAGCPNAMIGLGDKVDLDSPVVSIGKYGDGTDIANGDYVSGEITLTGSTSDDIGINSVKLSFDGGLTFSNASVAGNELSWSYLVDTSAYEDGEKDIIVIVTDTSPTPKTSEARLLLYFDNTAPLVVINSPAGYASTDYTDAIISLNGEATDQYPIRSVEVLLTGGAGTLSPVEGKYSWNCTFTSPGTGNYSFRIIAEDYAGNRTTHFYHYDDVLAANDSVFITPADVYKVENGEDVSNLTGAELSAIELSDLPISISMDLDNPIITISNPDPNALISDNVLPGNVKFIGSISDDDGINVSSVMISIDSNAWVSIETVNGSGLFVTWEDNMVFTESLDHTLQIKVEDIYGVEEISDLVNFRIDVDAAILDITSPGMSEYINSPDFSISGDASSSGGDITHIDISLDNGSSWNPVIPGTALPVTPLTWTYNATGVSDGIVVLKGRASDDDGSTWSYTNLQITVDTQNPVSGFTSPAFSSYVNGDVVIRGTSSDNNLLETVEIKIGDNEGWITIPDVDKYNWTHTIDSLLYENPIDGIETAVGSGIFRLNVYTRATDVAGNVYETTSGDHYFYIDNALDSPEVSIIYPSAEESLGGSLIVTGTSSDDDGAVSAVYMQIDVNTAPGGTPDFADTSVDLGVNGIDFDGPGGNEEVTIINETTAYIIDGSSLWSVEMNTTGELYDTDGAGSHSGDIHIRVYAEDINGLPGDFEELHFVFDDSIPLISNLAPASDSYVNDTFNITGDVDDETQIKHLEISYDGGTTYHYIIQNGVKQSDPAYNGSDAGMPTDYTLNTELDTSNIPDVGAVSSSDITIRFKVTDNTNYQSQESLTYYVDNNLPSGWMSQDTTDIFGSGDDAIFTGYADDTGIVSGVDRIDAYFVKNGFFYDPRTGNTLAVTTQMINGSSVPFTLDTDYKVVIDSTIETLSGANPDGDGIAEELNIGTFYEWKFRIDSSNIPDGISTLHYVVYDKSGNRFHNTKSVFIKNDKPVINSMKVGYDLDGNTTVEGDEIFTYAGQFKARDYLYFEFLASDIGGISTYEIFEGSDTSGFNPIHTIIGQIDISGKPEGVQTYFCQVTDGDGITDEILISVDIDNVDDIDPVFTLDILDQTSVITGHLEEDGDSWYDGTDPDVSGIIKFTGIASDDQGMQEIRLTLDGTLHTLANWSGGLFESREPANFVINTQTIDPNTGHQITWTYTWNTASIANAAKKDVSVVFTVDDFGTGPNHDTGSMTMDVVPYISSINTSVTTAFSDAFSRSALGRYPVRVNSNDTDFEIITVNGYNLNPSNTTDANSDVRISLDPDSLNPGKVGKGLTYGNIAADYTSLDVSMEVNGVGPLGGSGYLTVFTNGIPSINNINDNSGNSEGDYINPNLADDRFLSVWDLRLLRNDFTLANNAVYPGMSMNGDNPEFSYENNSQGWGIALYLDGVTEKFVYENWDLFTFTAIDHNSSGNQSLLYDINVVNGNNGDYNSGNYGGILANFFYDVPATSWNYWSYRFNDNQMWLENLVDEDSGTTAVLNRYQFPDIYTVGTTSDTSVFYSVYDSLKDKIVFRSFSVGTDATIDDVTGGRINDTGTALYTSLPQYEGDNSFPEYNGDRRFEGNNNAGKTPVGQHLIDDTNTSNYSAVAATSDGSTAVVAYYDAAGTGIVRLKYNNTPLIEAGWVDFGIIDTGHGGENIDMAIDSNDDIHIAFYDNNNGDLRYIYIPVTDFSTGIFGAVQSVIVDSYFDVGEKLTLELNSADIPYIAYKGVNRSGKVAWLDGALADGADSSDQFTGAWEIMIVPTQITSSDSNKFCVGVDTDDLPVVGYTNDGIEYIRLLENLLD